MKNIKKYAKLLEVEKDKLLKELETVGRKNPHVPGDWEAVETDLDSDSADVNETADEIEEYENNSAILSKLEEQLRDVNLALEKITDGTYGKCDVCGKEISEERLNANPASLTCIEHSK